MTHLPMLFLVPAVQDFLHVLPDLGCHQRLVATLTDCQAALRSKVACVRKPGLAQVPAHGRQSQQTPSEPAAATANERAVGSSPT